MALLLIGSANATVWIANGGDGGVQIGGFPIIIAQLQDDNQHIVGKVDLINDEINYRVMINPDGKLCFQWSENNTIYDKCGTTTLSNNTAYSFGVSITEYANDTYLNIYLNNSLELNETINWNPDTNNEIITMAQTSDGTGQYIGILDNVRIYDKSLNSTQISSEISAQYAQEHPIFAYDFEYGSNTTAYDTHLKKWNAYWGILMSNGDYDDSIQCVTYDSPGGTYIDNYLVRLILDNILLLVAVGILATIWIGFVVIQ